MYTASLGKIANRTPRLEVPLEALEAEDTRHFLGGIRTIFR